MNVRMNWFYSIAKSKESFPMSSDYLSAEQCLRLLADLERTGRLEKPPTIIDEQGNEWSKKTLKQYLNDLQTKPHHITAYIDGGFHKNSKTASIGVVIYFKQNGENWRIRFNDQLQLLEDNNEAEFAALYRLIERLEQMSVMDEQITVHSDSLTVIKQASGEWPSYEENYRSWLDRIDLLTEKNHLSINYEQIDRSKNKEADRLTQQALEGIVIDSISEKV